MDYTPLLDQLHRQGQESIQLLSDCSLVLCLGNRLVLSLLATGFSSPGKLLGAATTEAEGLALVKRHQPDVLICSDRLEAGCGVNLVLAVKAQNPERRTLLVVTNRRRRAGIRAAIQAGCDGLCLESQVGLGSGTAAVRAVCGGGLFIDRGLRSAFDHPQLDGLDGSGEALTERELDVLTRAMEGSNNAEIAGQLYVTTETVKSHMARVIAKLGARNRTHAAVLAMRQNLVE